MNYATASELRGYLPQIATGTGKDAELTTILTRATSIIDGALGFAFNVYPVTPSAMSLYADTTPYLLLPPANVNSVTGVTDAYGTPLMDYAPFIVRKRAYLYRPFYGWPYGPYPLTATAVWGYGPPPPSITEVCLELAVNIWRSKDKGLFSDVIGVDTGGGAVVGYMGALTNQQKMIVAGVKRDFDAVGF